MIKTLGAKIYAAIAHRKNQKWITRPIDAQKKVFNLLIKRGLKTRFGKEHDFEKIKSIKETMYKKNKHMHLHSVEELKFNLGILIGFQYL